MWGGVVLYSAEDGVKAKFFADYIYAAVMCLIMVVPVKFQYKSSVILPL